MREVLLHGGMDEAFDRSIVFARRLAESFGARLHVLYTVEDPLSAGWTAEVSADRLPEVHEAMEIEARQRLSSFISEEDQERLGRPDRARHRPGRRGDRALRQRAGHRSGDRPGQSGRRGLVRARAGRPGGRAQRRARPALTAVIEPELLVSAYASGWFPMAVEGGEIRWFSPDPRGIIPLDDLPRAAAAGARRGASGRFEIVVESLVPEVDRRVRRDRPRPRRPGHLDHDGDHRELRRAARARAGALGRGVARRPAGRRPLRRRTRRRVLRRVDVPPRDATRPRSR